MNPYFFSAHRNDLENILPGFLLGFLFVLTNPSPLSAALLFKVGALARIIHTVVYSVFPIPQPARFERVYYTFINLINITIFVCFQSIILGSGILNQHLHGRSSCNLSILEVKNFLKVAYREYLEI